MREFAALGFAILLAPHLHQIGSRQTTDETIFAMLDGEQGSLKCQTCAWQPRGEARFLACIYVVDFGRWINSHYWNIRFRSFHHT